MLYCSRYFKHCTVQMTKFSGEEFLKDGSLVVFVRITYALSHRSSYATLTYVYLARLSNVYCSETFYFLASYVEEASLLFNYLLAS